MALGERKIKVRSFDGGLALLAGDSFRFNGAMTRHIRLVKQGQHRLDLGNSARIVQHKSYM